MNFCVVLFGRVSVCVCMNTNDGYFCCCCYSSVWCLLVLLLFLSPMLERELLSSSAIYKILGPLHNVLFEQHSKFTRKWYRPKDPTNQHIDFPFYANDYPPAATFNYCLCLFLYTEHTLAPNLSWMKRNKILEFFKWNSFENILLNAKCLLTFSIEFRFEFSVLRLKIVQFHLLIICWRQ